MNLMKVKILSHLVLFLTLFPIIVFSNNSIVTLDDLLTVVNGLPTNRSLLQKKDISYKHKGISNPKELEAEVESWMHMRAKKMQNEALWKTSNQNQVMPDSKFFNPEKSKSFTPFVEKVVVGSSHKFLMRGDLHGDIHSLAMQLKEMKSKGLIDNEFKLKPGVNMAFLGDFVDRGNYGAEVLFTIARLGNANPGNVFYTRGNHEDINICSLYGFKDEMMNKFGSSSLYEKICRMYDYMPTALYLGNQKNEYIQLCHGGIEPGYDPKKLLESDKKYQLIGALNRKDEVDRIILSSSITDSLRQNIQNLYSYMKNGIILKNPTDDFLPLGHMWNDFDSTGKDTSKMKINARGVLECGQEIVNYMLEDQSDSKVRVVGVIRAHQHSTDPFDPMMQNLKKYGGCWNMRGCGCEKGIGNSIDKDVLTLNVSPDSVYGQYAEFDDNVAIEVALNRSGNGWSVKKHKYNSL